MRLRLCYLGCRYHRPPGKDGRLKKRSCPARRFAYQVAKAGYPVRQNRGMVETDAPKDLLNRILAQLATSPQAKGPG